MFFHVRGGGHKEGEIPCVNYLKFICRSEIVETQDSS